MIGGATGLVGDPSGRNTERPLSEASAVQSNVEHLVSSISRFFSGAIAFFSVQTRLSSQQGISFTEFTYQLLQGYDFYNLHKNHACTIQLGGSDQWGNILAGIDLINKLDPVTDAKAAHTERAFGITMPLLTTPSGEKFGKSAGNAVALDENITSVFDFYQFFLRTPDSHVGQYLRMFTWLPISQIDDVMNQHERSPEMRIAQRLLACELTELVHGEQAVNRAQAASKVLFDSDYAAVKTADVLLALKGDPRLQYCELAELLDVPIAKLASKYQLVASNSAAKQLIAGNGLYINNVAVQDNQQKVQQTDLIDGRLVILRSGSQKQLVLAIN
ncbi:hypothetical protein EIP86_003364 [Pleurotus ostreatoroseus]|nr:hypothetical protein EIP86_003364 [Pleurotus ostreatoroseus]